MPFVDAVTVSILTYIQLYYSTLFYWLALVHFLIVFFLHTNNTCRGEPACSPVVLSRVRLVRTNATTVGSILNAVKYLALMPQVAFASKDPSHMVFATLMAFVMVCHHSAEQGDTTSDSEYTRVCHTERSEVSCPVPLHWLALVHFLIVFLSAYK